MNRRLLNKSYAILTQIKKFHMDTYNSPDPTYGGRYVIALLPGLGIGPEIYKYVRIAFEEIGVPIDFQELHIDKTSEEETDLDYLSKAIARNAVALIGVLGVHTYKSFDVELRNRLNLIQNVTHVKSYPNIPARRQDVDIVLVRMNTGAEYSMLEHEPVPGVVTYLKIIEKDNAIKVIEFAFLYARYMKRKKVTTVHKANIMKLTDGLFLEVARTIARKYPDIEHKEMIIDNACMQLIKDHKQFDVIVTTNLYGMLVVNILCGLAGGPGLMPSVSVGLTCQCFENAARAPALDLENKNLANPVSYFHAGLNLLKFLGFQKHGDLIMEAIVNTIVKKQIRTRDIGGKNTTEDVANSIIDYLNENRKRLKIF